ncbi:NTF2-like protein [Clavulina sp. PMI_390]|nr:NTF2-like protein [Clavulina sp. PMI_390]
MASAPVVRTDVQIANRGAESFLRLYYNAYDSTTRAETISKFYRDTSTFSWNGTAIVGVEKIKEFMAKLPISKHEMQSWDCHSLQGFGNAAAGTPPSLHILVTGTVTHGKDMDVNARQLANLPRTFSQTFVLIPETPPPVPAGQPAPAAEPKYYVSMDAMRFVG